MEKKELTEKDCLEEVLRLVKIFCFNKIDKSEIPHSFVNYWGKQCENISSELTRNVQKPNKPE